MYVCVCVCARASCMAVCACMWLRACAVCRAEEAPQALAEMFKVCAVCVWGAHTRHTRHTRGTQWMEVHAGDDEKTVAKKRKLQKGWKSKQRFTKLDLATKKKQQSWLDFKTGKGAKKKARARVC